MPPKNPYTLVGDSLTTGADMLKASGLMDRYQKTSDDGVKVDPRDEIEYAWQNGPSSPESQSQGTTYKPDSLKDKR